MIIKDIEYRQLIRITDSELAKYICDYDKNHIDRIVGGMEYEANGQFKDICFAINYSADDSIIKTIVGYEFIEYYKSDPEKIVERMVQRECDIFVGMNWDKFKKKYFNLENIKDIYETESV